MGKQAQWRGEASNSRVAGWRQRMVETWEFRFPKKKKLILNRNRWKERLVYSDSQRRRNSQKIELERRADWNRSNPRCKADLEGETAMKERRNIATKGESELKEKERNRILKKRNGSELFLNGWARDKFAQLPIPRTLRDPKLSHPLTPFSSRESKAQSCLQKKRQKLNVSPLRGFSPPCILFPYPILISYGPMAATKRVCNSWTFFSFLFSMYTPDVKSH